MQYLGEPYLELGTDMHTGQLRVAVTFHWILKKNQGDFNL